MSRVSIDAGGMTLVECWTESIQFCIDLELPDLRLVARYSYCIFIICKAMEDYVRKQYYLSELTLNHNWTPPCSIDLGLRFRQS